MDDILVSGAAAESHLSNLRGLLERLDAKGFRCGKEKYVFDQQSIEYLGYNLSIEGISKGPNVDAVINMPTPENVSELRAFLGQVQFHGKFLPNLLKRPEIDILVYKERHSLVLEYKKKKPLSNL